VLGAEVATGVTIGVLCGLLTGVVALFLEAEVGLAYTFAAGVGLAIAIAVSWASLLGCLVPILCRRAGIDPAIVAGPFLITLSDLSATAIFMLVAQAVRGFSGALG
jgi:magnesium transporter